MFGLQRSRIKKTGLQIPLLLVLFLLVCIESAWAQTGQPGVLRETTTGLTMRFPVELVVRDPQQAINEGHMAVFGSMQTEAKKHQLASQCIKPILLGELPDASAATLLFYEFIATKECKADFKYKDDEAITGGLAQTALHLPGATPLSQPLWFDMGKQKLHVAFSLMEWQNNAPDQSPALLAMAAMRYHGHILGWMMIANRLNTFNGLTKTSIELDDRHVYPLVPFNLDDHLQLPIK